jgi:hypothetical protein
MAIRQERPPHKRPCTGALGTIAAQLGKYLAFEQAKQIVSMAQPAPLTGGPSTNGVEPLKERKGQALSEPIRMAIIKIAVNLIRTKVDGRRFPPNRRISMRYFFDFHEGDEVTLDEEGMELVTIDRVLEEAARSLADIARDHTLEHARSGVPLSMAIQVRDEQGPVLQATFIFSVNRSRH